MWDLGFAVLNSIGLYNLGIEDFLKKELPEYLGLGFDYGISLSGFSVDEFKEVIDIAADAVKNIEAVKVIELNFSCPNVKEGGIQFASQPQSIKEISSFAAQRFDKEVWVKVSPAYDIESQVKASLEAGATAVVVANTMPASALNGNLKPVLGSFSGGISGPGLFPINFLKVSKAVAYGIPVIASGGVDSFASFISYLKAGAVCAGVGTALFKDPELPGRIIKRLKEEMASSGFDSFQAYVEEFLRR